MKAKLLFNTLTSLFQTRRTVCIEGAPGGGKTTIVREVADSLGVPVVELHMPTMLVEDFGVLYPDSTDSSAATPTLSYRLPQWFPDEANPDTPKDGILLFDDRNQASPDLQKVLANICQARTLHGHRLPDGWQVVSTGNRQSDRAGANRVLSHLRNRETVITLDTSVPDWTRWAAAHGVAPEVVAFINFRPDLLHDFDAARDVNPTPRSWVDGVSAMLTSPSPLPDGADYEVFAGAVGEGAATEFVGFLRTWRSLPDVNGIFANPQSATVPTAPDVLYALCGALAKHVTAATMGAFVEYLARIPREFSVLSMRIAIDSDTALVKDGKRAQEESLQRHAAFVKWAVENQEVLF